MGAGNKQKTTEDEPGYYYNAWTTGSIIADCSKRDLITGLYDLKLKVAISGFSDGYIKDEAGNPLHFIRPYMLRVSTTHSGANFLEWPDPTGLNLTQPDPDLSAVAEFVFDVVAIIASEGCAPVGYVLTAWELATKFLGLLKTPTGKTYEWPHGVGWYTHDLPYYALSKTIQGEVYLLISGLSSGVPHTIPITFEVAYCYPNYDPSLGWYPVDFMIESFTLNIGWSTTPDDVNLPPDPPSTPSGPASGIVGTTYSYSTSTTDPNGDPVVQYQFNWGDGSTTLTGSATASHSWSLPRTYQVKVQAQDSFGLWSDWSPPLTVNIRNLYLTVLAQDSRGLTSGYVYIDGQYCGRTGSTFAVTMGTHTVFVDNVCWGRVGGIEGYFRYVFLLWEDGSTANPRTIPVVEDTTIKAYFDGKWCPGDVDGSGTVDWVDIGLLGLAYGSRPGDSNWNSAADLDASGAVDWVDLNILGQYYNWKY
ncbi:MAG: PKD domain-containing protein [Candidatus Bathyarchaeaceae archaeon]